MQSLNSSQNGPFAAHPRQEAQCRKDGLARSNDRLRQEDHVPQSAYGSPYPSPHAAFVALMTALDDLREQVAGAQKHIGN